MRKPVQTNNIYAQLEELLGTLQIGDTASDHRAELEGFNGWNYVAITAVARQALRSLVYVYDDAGTESQLIRKSLRLEYGAKWRTTARADKEFRKALVREHQGEVVGQEHPLVRLLHRPNPYQSGGSFRWEQIQQLRLHGTCLIFERPNMTMNRTVQRYVIPMAMVIPMKPGSRPNMPRGGIRIIPPSGSGAYGDTFGGLRQFYNVEVPAEWLTIIKYPHPHLRGDGASPTMAASRWIDAATMVDKTRSDFYRDGPNGKVLITGEFGDPKQIEEIEDRLSRRLGEDGPRVTVIGNGAQVASKRTADEMAFNDAHDQLRDATFAAQGVSRAMTGTQEGMTYGSLAAALLGSTMLSVQPDMDLIADEETVSIGRQYGKGVCIEYEVPAINDPELEDRRLESDSKIGVMTVGEYRMKRGEPLFGNEYDNYILTAEGPRSPESLRERVSVPGTTFPDATDQFDVPSISTDPLMLPKSFRVENGVILIDETLRVSLDEEICDAFQKSGFELRPMMDQPDEEDRVVANWDWRTGNDWREIVKCLPACAAVEQLESRLNEIEVKKRKYACVLLPFPDDVARRLLEDANAIDDESLAEGGRELEPHVTALYGIMGTDLEDIVRVVSRMTSPMIRFGGIEAFPSGDDGFPLHVTIDSPDLVAMNEQLRSSLPHVVKHPNYQPHATLAYVHDPRGWQGNRASVTGKTCFASKAIISMPDGTRAVVPLKRPYIEGEASTSGIAEIAIADEKILNVVKGLLAQSPA